MNQYLFQGGKQVSAEEGAGAADYLAASVEGADVEVGGGCFHRLRLACWLCCVWRSVSRWVTLDVFEAC